MNKHDVPITTPRPYVKVRVRGEGWQYDGWLVSVFKNRHGVVRYAVEDDTGRILVHTNQQLGVSMRWGLGIRRELARL